MRSARRELWIASGILVPFAALVLVGLAWTRPAREPADGAPTTKVPPPAPVTAVGLTSPVSSVDASVPLDATSPEARRFPVELEAPLRAVEAEVRRCLLDQASRAPLRVAVTVAFRPTDGGGFEQVTVHPDWQDPYLEACVEDVFAELRWRPTGRETFVPVKYTFDFTLPRPDPRP